MESFGWNRHDLRSPVTSSVSRCTVVEVGDDAGEADGVDMVCCDGDTWVVDFWFLGLGGKLEWLDAT